MNGRGRHPAAVWSDVQNCPITPCRLCMAEARADVAESNLAEAHRALTKSGVPEQIPPVKAPLAHVTVRILWLSARSDRLEADRDRLAGLIRAAEEDLGNVIYQIETGELRAAHDEVTAIRSRLDVAKEGRP